MSLHNAKDIEFRESHISHVKSGDQRNRYYDGPHIEIHNYHEDAGHQHSWNYRVPTSVHSSTSPTSSKPWPTQWIYTSLLLSKKEGYALWCPQTGIQIGDVGILYDHYQFERLLNIQPSGTSLTPSDNALEGPKRWWGANTAHVGTTNGQHYTTTIKRWRWNEASASFIKSSCVFRFDRSENGAILVLPEGSWRTTASLTTSTHFQDQAIERAKEWFHDAEKKLPKSPDSNEFLYLVTGFDKTVSWGISAFANERGNSVSLTFATHNNFPHSDGVDKYSWDLEDSSLGPGCRCHPDATDFHTPPSPTSENRVPDQCVFVRGYIITRRKPSEDIKVSDAVIDSDYSTLLFPVEERETSPPQNPRSERGENSSLQFGNLHVEISQTSVASGSAMASPAVDAPGSSRLPRAQRSKGRHPNVDSFQESILESVFKLYEIPFRPEPKMTRLLAELLSLESKIIEQWFLTRRLIAPLINNTSMHTRTREPFELEETGQQELLVILMKAWTERHGPHPPYPNEVEVQSICQAAKISIRTFELWKDNLMKSPAAEDPDDQEEQSTTFVHEHSSAAVSTALRIGQSRSGKPLIPRGLLSGWFRK